MDFTHIIDQELLVERQTELGHKLLEVLYVLVRPTHNLVNKRSFQAILKQIHFRNLTIKASTNS